LLGQSLSTVQFLFFIFFVVVVELSDVDTVVSIVPGFTVVVCFDGFEGVGEDFDGNEGANVLITFFAFLWCLLAFLWCLLAFL